MNMTEYENKLKEKVKSCIDTTSYAEYQIENMIENGLYLLSKIFSLDYIDYELDDDKKTQGIIKIKDFHFNHNDMLIYYDDYFTSRALKEIFNDWKDKKYFEGYKSNGHGTAIVISFNCYEKINDFESLIKRINIKSTIDDFDDKLKNIKYI